jgi:HK97 family phage major capsid protein
MSTLRSLLAERARISAALEEINNQPVGDGGGLSTEQRSRWDSLATESKVVNEKIDRQSLIDENERRMSGQPIAGTGDNRLDTDLRGYSLVRALAGAAGIGGVDWGRERELSAEVARRSGRAYSGICVPMQALQIEKRVVTSGGSGANIISTDLLAAQFIDVLRAKTFVRRLGATVLSGLTGNIEIPRLTGSSSVGWVSENSALTPSDPTYDQVALTARHCGGITELSRTMLGSQSPDVEQLVRNDFARLLAKGVDDAAINGAGSPAPTGILHNGSVASTTITPTWADVLAMVATIQTADADDASLAWAMNGNGLKKLRSTLVAGSTDSRMIMSDPNNLVGYPAVTSSIVPNNGNSPSDQTTLILGAWDSLVIGFYSELDVLLNPFESTAYIRGNVQIRAMMTADIQVRHAAAFTYAKMPY